MANTASAAKNSRKATRRHEARVTVKSELKTLRKKTLQLVSDKKPVAEISTSATNTIKKFARAAANGYIHKRTASRKIGRLMRALHKGGVK